MGGETASSESSTTLANRSPITELNSITSRYEGYARGLINAINEVVSTKTRLIWSQVGQSLDAECAFPESVRRKKVVVWA